MILNNNDMMKIISDLYLKDRTFICEDYDFSLNYLKQYLDIEILEYPSGAIYSNWVIPSKYTVNEAYIKNLNTGKIIADAKKHPLVLASYSSSFEGNLNYNELKEKI